jgi:hypothetical protein
MKQIYTLSGISDYSQIAVGNQAFTFKKNVSSPMICHPFYQNELLKTGLGQTKKREPNGSRFG